jgi:hypothetical protein
MLYKKGDVVLRSIEGMTFIAKVLDVSKRNAVVNLQYLDDGNIEEDVPFDEICLRNAESKDHMDYEVPLTGKVETLAKPLLGLVEDDCEARKKHQPTIFIHESKQENEEEKAAIILHGAENKLAAGGGLRALRYLKK